MTVSNACLTETVVLLQKPSVCLPLTLTPAGHTGGVNWQLACQQRRCSPMAQPKRLYKPPFQLTALELSNNNHLPISIPLASSRRPSSPQQHSLHSSHPSKACTMKTFTAASAVMFAFSSFVTATVFKGTLNGGNIAWFNGADMCADKVGLDSNICDVRISSAPFPLPYYPSSSRSPPYTPQDILTHDARQNGPSTASANSNSSAAQLPASCSSRTAASTPYVTSLPRLFVVRRGC